MKTTHKKKALDLRKVTKEKIATTRNDSVRDDNDDTRLQSWNKSRQLWKTMTSTSFQPYRIPTDWWTRKTDCFTWSVPLLSECLCIIIHRYIHISNPPSFLVMSFLGLYNLSFIYICPCFFGWFLCSPSIASSQPIVHWLIFYFCPPITMAIIDCQFIIREQ